MVTVATGWQIAARDADNALLGFVGGYTSLRLTLRYRRGGSWVVEAPQGTGVELLQPGARIQIVRREPATRLTYSQLAGLHATYTALGLAVPTYSASGWLAGAISTVAEGYVTRIEDRIDESGRVLTVSGITDAGLLADRLTLPTPEAAFNAQTTVAYWTESGPAEFIIHRLVCRNLGMGAQGPRQVVDSRVGTLGDDAPRKTAADWTDVSTAGVTWSGDTATITASSTAALRTTDAINLGTDMATVVGRVEVSGPCQIGVIALFNTTAAGAAPGQPGVVTETSTIHVAGNVGASTLWLAEAFRVRNSGKVWVRFQVNVQASGATRTVEFLNEGGVYVKSPAGSTVTVNTRFKNLGEEVEELAAAGDVVVDADTANDMPRIVVRAGADKTDEVKLSRAYGNVLTYNTVLGAPQANVVLVAGEGEGTARVTTSRSDSASLTEWGRRIEKFRDARDVDAADTALLAQRGDEELEESARVAGWLVETLDNQAMRWPDDYQVGDTVTVLTGSAASTDVVSAVEVRIDSEGAAVRPVLGSSELADNEPGLYAAVRDLRRRLDQLEGRV